MSADNFLHIIADPAGQTSVHMDWMSDEGCSLRLHGGGFRKPLFGPGPLQACIEYAHGYCTENVVEYGVQIDEELLKADREDITVLWDQLENFIEADMPVHAALTATTLRKRLGYEKEAPDAVAPS